LWKKVGKFSIFGADFSYTTNVHFGELGRACCEFWLSKCMDAGIDVSVAARSPMLDTNVALKEKLYGYHRLENPPVVYLNNGGLKVAKLSEVEHEEIPTGVSGRNDIGAPEPKKY
jgi:hypothetical protein